MRQTLNDIVVNELQAEHDEIIEYRKAVASGIEDYVDPVLDDIELTNAFEKVISHYKTKGYIPSDYDQYDFNFPIDGIEGISYEDIGDINWKDDISIMGTDDDTK